MYSQDYLIVLQGIAMKAYSVDVSLDVTDGNKFKSPLAFDAFDLSLGSDFDSFMEDLL